jgi:hypothetical protein
MSQIIKLAVKRDDKLWAVMARLGRLTRIAEIHSTQPAALAECRWREQQVTTYAGFLRHAHQPLPVYTVVPFRRADLPRNWRPLPALGFLHGKLI